MIKILILLAIVISGCAAADFNFSDTASADVRVVSLNIHYLVPSRDRTDWENRRYAVSAALEEIDADIVLFQEMETFEGGHAPGRNLQLDWVLGTVDGYTAGAVGDPDLFPVTQPILYRTGRFKLLEQGFFFFSDTPDVIYSEPWDGSWPAYVSWVKLLVLGGAAEDGTERAAGRSAEEFPSAVRPRILYVFNAHLDAFSRENRVKGVRLIAERVRDRDGKEVPVILAGDFNGLKGAGFLDALYDSGLGRAAANGSTYHFGRGINLYGAIDHIFYGSGLAEVQAVVVRGKWLGEWPSDHYPVFASFNWREEQG